MDMHLPPPAGWPAQWPWPLPQPAPAEMTIPFASDGLVPKVYDDQWIKHRIPYTIPGELEVAANSSGNFFPEDVFKNAASKPFEIHWINVRLTAISNDTPRFIYDPQPTTLNKHVRLKFTEVETEQNLNKAMQLVDPLLEDDSLTWRWPIPYTISNQSGFNVQVDATVLPRYCVEISSATDQDCTATVVAVPYVRVEITFIGYFLVLAPPSEA